MLLLILLAACGPVPKPFVTPPDKKVSNPLLERSDSESLVVAPIEGASSDLAGPLAERLAESLRWLEIPASTAPHVERAHLLEGEALWRDGVLVVVWHLSDAEGQWIGQVSDLRPVSLTDFEKGSDDLVDRLTGHAAPEIADLLARRNVEGRLDEALPSETDEPDEPRIAILGVSGAPGDGDQALPRAMARVIQQAGLPYTDRARDAVLKLAGTVEPAGPDALTITWAMTDRKGEAVGSLDQPVPIPPEDLSERWGANAFDAAIAMLRPLARALDAVVAKEAAEDAGNDSGRKGLVNPFAE